MERSQTWERLKTYYFSEESLGVDLDISRMDFPESFLDEMSKATEDAFDEMHDLEGGSIANLDEDRMVGHYWLRDPSVIDDVEPKEAIEGMLAKVRDFCRKVHRGELTAQRGEPFRNLLIIGIGGSALGPQFVSHALKRPDDPMRAFFFDNTDPDGMDRVLAEIGRELCETLAIVISKSGGTEETRNGMLEARAAYEREGLVFEKHAVAITGVGSELDEAALSQGWLERFPMWDWIGGRTSELSAVGLLPACLQGIDIDRMLDGAKAMDRATRARDILKNPAALLALMWYWAGEGRGRKRMVVLPYKDRLELLSKYLQQLVMESLGKELDRQGNVVQQGLTVYGNKGSTDQHAYVQQLRDGTSDFFVTFIEVLRDRDGSSIEVEDGVTSGDYLSGFLQGTRRALQENGRESITITVPDVSPATIGKLIALYERVVGLYASLIDVNAYHQPGVEAGKRAASAVIEMQRRILALLRERVGQRMTCEEVAAELGADDQADSVFTILRHLAANLHHNVKRQPGESPFDCTYWI